MPSAVLTICFRGKSHALHLNLVSKLIKLDQRVSSFHTNALYPCTQVFEFEVSAGFGTLKLLVVIIEVDAFIIFKVDLSHFCFSLTLTLHC